MAGVDEVAVGDWWHLIRPPSGAGPVEVVHVSDSTYRMSGPSGPVNWDQPLGKLLAKSTVGPERRSIRVKHLDGNIAPSQVDDLSRKLDAKEIRGACRLRLGLVVDECIASAARAAKHDGELFTDSELLSMASRFLRALS